MHHNEENKTLNIKLNIFRYTNMGALQTTQNGYVFQVFVGPYLSAVKSHKSFIGSRWVEIFWVAKVYDLI